MGLLKDMGGRFQKLRKSKGIYTEDLAYKLDWAVSYISQIECGTVKLPLERYELLCAALGTTFTEFMGVYKWSYIEPKQNKMEVVYYVNYRKVS